MEDLRGSRNVSLGTLPKIRSKFRSEEKEMDMNRRFTGDTRWKSEFEEIAGARWGVDSGSKEIDAPTLYEIDARFVRGWEGSPLESSRLPKIYPEITLSDHEYLEKVSDRSEVDRNSDDERYEAISTQVLSVLERFVPNTIAYNFVNSVVYAIVWLCSLRLPSAKFSQSLWRRRDSAVVGFAWHAHLPRAAVAFLTGDVRIYDVDKNRWIDSIGTLSHPFQNDIASMAWQPLSGSGLAVGCRDGVCLWTGKNMHWIVHLNNYDARLAMLTQLRPISCMSWSPNGELLAVGSDQSPTIIVWDCATQSPTMLRRMAGNAFDLSWSPSGSYLYSAAQNHGFYVWETQTWTYEPYSCFENPIQSACWSKSGENLLLASSPSNIQPDASGKSDSVLYVLSLKHQPPLIDGEILPLTLNLSAAMKKIDLPCKRLSCLALNDTFHRLAVCFEDSRAVAIYAIASRPQLKFLLLGYVYGPSGTIARNASFKKNNLDCALLAVVFQDTSNKEERQTHIRFVPMYF